MTDIELVEFIRDNPGSEPAQVAERFSVSVRTVRTYVQRSNRAMSGFAAIELPRNMGYSLRVTDQSRLDAWLHRATPLVESHLPQTQEERVAYLINDLLARSDWVTIDALASILFVSRVTISNDLKRVEAVFEQFSLSIERRSHLGLRVVGSEIDRRLCLANVIIQYGGTSDGPMEDAISHLLLKGFAESEKKAAAHGGNDGGLFHRSALIDAIADCVQEVTDEAGFKFNSVAYQNLLVHLAIAVLRIKNNNYVPMEPQHLEAIEGTREYPVAQGIAKRLESLFDIAMPQEEVAYIAIHLAGKQTIEGSPGGTGNAPISDEIWGLVETMLELVWDVYHFDLRDDLELRMNLVRHVEPLGVRLQYHMKLRNPLLDDIKGRYPLAFSMAADASSVLAGHYNAKITEDEVGYIALAFALAIERQKAERPKKNLLVVCASGQGSARLLAWRCRREFGPFLGDITTCDVREVDQVDFSHIDYVFTTVPIGRSLPVPVREVRFFFDAGDVEQVKEDLDADNSKQASSVLKHFDRRLFFPHLAAGTKWEVLDLLIDAVERVHGVGDDFRDLVLRREAAVSTAFGNDIAMPHPLEPTSSKTFVCVAVLDHPVVWDEYGRTVRVVFLVSFGDSDATDRKGLYAALSDLLSSKRAVERLEEHPDWQLLEELVTGFVDTTGESEKSKT